LAGKVTAGLVESNDSLPVGMTKKVSRWLTAYTPGSTPGPTLGNEYRRTVPYFNEFSDFSVKVDIGHVLFDVVYEAMKQLI